MKILTICLLLTSLTSLAGTVIKNPLSPEGALYDCTSSLEQVCIEQGFEKAIDSKCKQKLHNTRRLNFKCRLAQLASFCFSGENSMCQIQCNNTEYIHKQIMNKDYIKVDDNGLRSTPELRIKHGLTWTSRNYANILHKITCE